MLQQCFCHLWGSILSFQLTKLTGVMPVVSSINIWAEVNPFMKNDLQIGISDYRLVSCLNSKSPVFRSSMCLSDTRKFKFLLPGVKDQNGVSDDVEKRSS